LSEDLVKKLSLVSHGIIEALQGYKSLVSAIWRAALTAVLLMLCPWLAYAADIAPVSAATVAQLMTRDVIGVPGKEVLMITVEYVPGGASVPHRHDAQVFVYVLEGALRMQVKGGNPVTVHAGETFYEAPGDIHQVSANASQTAAAKFLVFMIKDKAKPVSRDVTGKVGS
jgi:quercetin dioxygenase-like cupin family protein